MNIIHHQFKRIIQGLFRLLRIYHEISVYFRGLDMQIVHRSDLVGELFVDRPGAAAPFADVALESAVKASPGIAFNKNAEIEQVA